MTRPYSVTTVKRVRPFLPAPSSEVVAGVRHAARRELA